MKNSEYNNNWKKSLDLIKHENELVNHRLSTTLTFQGLLYAGIGFCSSKIFDLYKTSDIEFLFMSAAMILISSVGICSSVIVTSGLRAALRQGKASSLWLIAVTQCTCEHFKHAFPYPPIVGKPSKMSIGPFYFGNDAPYYNYYNKCEFDNKNYKYSCQFCSDCKKDTCNNFFENINNTKDLSTSTHYLLDIISITWVIVATSTISSVIYKIAHQSSTTINSSLCWINQYFGVY